MRKLLSMSMVVGLAACHRAPPPEIEPHPEHVIGDYSYRIFVGPTSVAGRFSIQPDTVTFEARSQSCRRLDTGITTYPALYHFRCGGGSTAINVVVNSVNPGLSTWNSMAPGQKEVNVCVQYVWNEKEEPYCMKTRKEMRMQMVRVGGPLDFTRIASTDKP